jgi:hypothetical protein
MRSFPSFARRCMAALALAMLVVGPAADARALSNGSVVVVRLNYPLGAGSQVVDDVGGVTAALVLEEYAPAGNLLQRIALPTESRMVGSAGNTSWPSYACTASRMHPSTQLSRSGDGAMLVFACLDLPPGSTLVSNASDLAGSVGVVVARLFLNGSVDTSLRLPIGAVCASVWDIQYAPTPFRGLISATALGVGAGKDTIYLTCADGAPQLTAVRALPRVAWSWGTPGASLPAATAAGGSVCHKCTPQPDMLVNVVPPDVQLFVWAGRLFGTKRTWVIGLPSVATYTGNVMEFIDNADGGPLRNDQGPDSVQDSHFIIVPGLSPRGAVFEAANVLWLLDTSRCSSDVAAPSEQVVLLRFELQRDTGVSLWVRTEQILLYPDTCYYGLDSATDAATGRITLYAVADSMVYAYTPAAHAGFVLASAPAWRAFLGVAVVTLAAAAPEPDYFPGWGAAANNAASDARRTAAYVGGGVAGVALVAACAVAWYWHVRRAARVFVYKAGEGALSPGGRARQGQPQLQRGQSRAGAALGASGGTAPGGGMGQPRPRTSIAAASGIAVMDASGSVVVAAPAQPRSSVTSALATAAAVTAVVNRRAVEAQREDASAAAYMVAVYAARKMQRRAEEHRRASASGAAGAPSPSSATAAQGARRKSRRGNGDGDGGGGPLPGGDPRGQIEPDSDAAWPSVNRRGSGPWHDEERGEAVLFRASAGPSPGHAGASANALATPTASGQRVAAAAVAAGGDELARRRNRTSISATYAAGAASPEPGSHR